MTNINVNVNAQKEEIVILTKFELETIIYRAVNAANGQLYDGLSKRYFQQFEDDIRTIMGEVEVLRRGEY